MTPSEPARGALAAGLPRPGDTIAERYRVETVLSTTEKAVVVAARHVWLRHAARVKVLFAYTETQSAARDRFVDTARRVATIESPHVNRVLDVGTSADGAAFVAFERHDGPTLEAELDEQGRIACEQAVRWALQMCCGLAALHAAGIVHGDLRPDNVLLVHPSTEGRRRRASADPSPLAMLTEVGTSSPIDALDDGGVAAFASAPRYAAPEQIRGGAVDARSDVWSVAVILFEMLSGKLPFEADTATETLMSITLDTPPLVTEAPYPLAKVIHGCLAKQPERRPADVAALAAALAPFAGEAGAALAQRAKETLSGPRRKKRERPPATPKVVDAVEAAAEEVTGGDTQPTLRTIAKRRTRRTSRIVLGTVAAWGVLTTAASIVIAPCSSVPAAPAPRVADPEITRAVFEIPTTTLDAGAAVRRPRERAQR